MLCFQWSDELLPNILKNPQIPEAETHRELKEHLYYMMIDYFDKGKVRINPNGILKFYFGEMYLLK